MTRSASQKSVIYRKSSDQQPTGRRCLIQEQCQTCTYINFDYQETLQTKFQQGLAKLQQADLLSKTQILDVQSSPRIQGYRTHAKLAVRKSQNPEERFSIGLFQPDSHKIINIIPCPVHKQIINKAASDIKEALENSTIEPYDENAHQGDLRYLSLRASHLTEELMLTFVATSSAIKPAIKLLVMHLRSLGHRLGSVNLNINPGVTNSIFGPQTELIYGKAYLRERLCDFDLEVGPTSFLQVNPWQAENIYQRIAQISGESTTETAWDLYCGIGVIGLLLGKAGYRSLGIEENGDAIKFAEQNAKINQLQDNASFLAGKVEDVLGQIPPWAKNPGVIVTNPSRRGLAEPVRQQLVNLLKKQPKLRLIYMSCEMDTLVRDLKDLSRSGRILRQIEGFDMFPFTDKMEWLAVFS